MGLDDLAAGDLARSDGSRQLQRSHLPQFAHHPIMAQLWNEAIAALGDRCPPAHAAGRRRPGRSSAPRAAVGEGGIVWWRVGAALVVSLALQIGVNYANDYSDGVRGTDAVRVGPVRLVASGMASPAGGQAGRVRRVRGRRARRAGVGGRHDVVAAGRRAWRASPRRGATPAGRRRTATWGSARCSSSCSSASWRRSAPPTSRSSGSPALAVVRRMRRRLPRVRAARRQQPPRHPDRHGRRQAHAWPCGSAIRGHAMILRRAGRRRVRVRRRSPRSGARRRCSRCSRSRSRPCRSRAVVDRASGPALIAVLGATGRAQLAYGALFAARAGARRLTSAAEPRHDRGAGLLGPLEMGGVAGAFDDARTMASAIASAIRRPIAVNLASCSPATTSTGIASSPSRSHSGSCVPVPASRKLDARPGAVLRQAGLDVARPRGRAGEQWLRQPASTNAATPMRSISSAELVVGGAAVVAFAGRPRCPAWRRSAPADRRGAAMRGRGAGTGVRPSSSRRTWPARPRRRASRRRRAGRLERRPSRRGPGRRARRSSTSGPSARA